VRHPGHAQAHFSCHTCPRKYHYGCLEAEGRFFGFKAYNRSRPAHYCPLCRKRTWDQLEPLTTKQLEDKGLRIRQRDNRLLIVIANFASRRFLDRWLPLKDDGSIRSDGTLVHTMGVVNMETKVRASLKELLTPEIADIIVERRSGVVPEALKFDLLCMDKRYPCLRGKHKREHLEIYDA
jgi:hypothetical protein